MLIIIPIVNIFNSKSPVLQAPANPRPISRGNKKYKIDTSL